MMKKITGSYTWPRLRYRSPFARKAIWTTVLSLFLIISGKVVVESGAGQACGGWPLCGESLLPSGALGWVNFSHRLVSLLVGGMMISLLVSAWRSQRSQTWILLGSTLTVTLYFSQVLTAGAKVLLDYPPRLVWVHTVTSVVLWVSLVVLVFLVGLAARGAKEERKEAAEFFKRDKMVRDFLALTKPIVVALLLVTTFAGMVIGARSWPRLDMIFIVLVAGAMAAGGSGAINQYIDRDEDKKMHRTQERPIPDQRLTPAEGLAFGAALCVISFYVMVVFVNLLAALLTLAGIVYYVVVYSIFLKKITVQNIVIGGGAGAIPPLVGWAASTGSLNVPSLFLFAIVFMWTPPHFWSLAIVRRRDYARADVPMLPVVRGVEETRWQILLYTVALVILTLLLPVVGLGSAIYLFGAVILGAWLILSAWRVWRDSGNKMAYKMYRHSSIYLGLLFAVLMVDALV